MSHSTHSWTDIERMKLSNRPTRPRHQGDLDKRRSSGLTDYGMSVIAEPNGEVGYGQVVPDQDAATVTYCSYCQTEFGWPWPSERRTYQVRCLSCGRSNDYCLTLPRWEFYNLYVRESFVIDELP